VSGSASGLTLVGASAGSGKTYRITEVVGDAVDPNHAHAVSPEGLVAVTYTRKAAGELASRIRKKLVGQHAFEEAHLLPLAYLGTVHSVCLRLVQEFALDAGLSPKVDVLSGDDQRWLRQALEWGLRPELRARIEDLAARMELRKDHRTGRHDWLTPVQDIMTLARSNRMSPESLSAMAQRSADGLLSLLPPPAADGDALDRALLVALEEASTVLSRLDDGLKNTKEARERVRTALRDAARGPLPWPTWARLMRVQPAKKLVPVVAPLVEAARAGERHPRLHADIRDLTSGVFEAARFGLHAYDAWKKHRRVVDYVDMIDRALELLDHDQIAAELARRLRLLVVDEMQDTSPIQLALFARLHRLVGRSTWVGDRKQCIFEFAGADPALMEAVASWAAREGGSSEQLGKNWRSRPELVQACNHLFGAAFAQHGHSVAEVSVDATRASKSGTLPAFGVWSLEAGNGNQDATAIAEGVQRLLATPEETPIEDRETGTTRPLRPGDIAILVGTNAEAARITAALARRGTSASVTRDGLMTTPEGTLVRAALGYVLDPRDTLSAAVIDALLGFEGGDPDEWLSKRLQAEDAPRSKLHTRLDELRSSLEAYSPAEALDAVMHAVDLVALCRRWPDPELRVANIDALRALTAKYEERCERLHESATLAGLLRFLDEAAERVLIRDEERASDEQHVAPEGGAVTIVTYHKSKGLEWPVVVLASLDRAARRTVFEVTPETDRTTFDPEAALAGRWIRYWPSPFNIMTPLDERAARSQTGVALAEREARERIRLLYVGFTRARDHLILAARPGHTHMKTQWLDELRDADGALLVLPQSDDGAGRTEIAIRGVGGELRVPARRWVLAATEPTRPALSLECTWFRKHEPTLRENVGYWISPSSATGETSPDAGTAEVARVGDRLQLGRTPNVEWNLVGDVVHAFLAADERGLSTEQRRARAGRILNASTVRGALDEEASLIAGDQLRSWVEGMWPHAEWHREYPIDAVIAAPPGARRIRGTVDLLLDTGDGIVIIDHKTFPGPSDKWAEKAIAYLPQMRAYSRVLSLAGRRMLGSWIHFPIGGGAVRVA
jgi:ATP-dependent helicase/nuclease subunit A